MRRWAGHASGFGQGVSRALCTPRPPGCAPRPSHSHALALAAASLICTRPIVDGHHGHHGHPLGETSEKKNPRLAGAHGFHADGRGGTWISTREPRVGGGTTRIASDRRWPPWPPWPPLGSDPPKNIFSSWSVGVLTSGNSPRYFFYKTFLLGVAKVAMVATANHRADPLSNGRVRLVPERWRRARPERCQTCSCHSQWRRRQRR